jgi:Domain of unknown function (DUF6457)
MTDHDIRETQRILAEWVSALRLELDAAEAPVDIEVILGLAGTAAHAVLRPAAPLTTYLLGYVAGRAAGGSHTGFDGAGLDATVAAIQRLAADYRSSSRE